MKSISIIVNKYPNELEPNVCVFIQQLVWSLADNGIKCVVVAPVPINLNIKYVRFSKKRDEYTENGNKVEIFHPKYISLGQKGKTLQKLRVNVTTKLFTKAVDSFMKSRKELSDVLYAHFICPTGVAVSKLGKKYAKPTFMAYGESTYQGDEKYGNSKLAYYLDGLSGVIAVSTHSKNELVNAGVMEVDKIKIFPNGYRKERFKKIDRAEARRKFNLPKDAFIVGFCGSFDERKGILRLEKAIEQMDDVYFACAGKGKLKPTSDKCLLAKPVNNDELQYFYSALDAFVLPTQNEGCCNAIVEAIACGCPIVSSDKSFNYDICDETNSILIDPNNIDEIKNAIITLKNSSNLREKLSNGSLLKAENLTLDQRAKNIISWIDICCKKDEGDNK